MKVHPETSVNTKLIHQESKVTHQGHTNFQNVMQNQQSKMQMAQIQQLLTNINEAGERLAKSRNFRDLAKYKGLIQSFIKEAAENGFQTKTTTTWTETGQNRNLKIIEQIDEKLIQLTDEILEKEKKNINILGILGEIKGLLVNLYI